MRILGLLAAALLVAGCTVSRTGGAAPAAESTPTFEATVSSSPPSSGPPSSGPVTYEDEAADCADAECSIAIDGRVDVPLEPRFGFTDFVVTFVPPETVTFEGADPVNGDAHGTLSGTGYMSLNGIMITVAGYGPAGAKLQFEPPS
jgi:hypothetical protein